MINNTSPKTATGAANESTNVDAPEVNIKRLPNNMHNHPENTMFNFIWFCRGLL